MRHLGNELGREDNHCFWDIEKPDKGINFTLRFLGNS
jgi:hypothetical protein